MITSVVHPRSFRQAALSAARPAIMPSYEVSLSVELGLMLHCQALSLHAGLFLHMTHSILITDGKCRVDLPETSTPLSISPVRRIGGFEAAGPKSLLQR